MLLTPNRNKSLNFAHPDAIHTDTYIMGEHVDAWGCVWRNVQQGMEAIVTAHPVPTRAAVRKPELLVFDDLSSALDVEMEQALWDGVFARSDEKDAMCLVVSHRRPALRRWEC